MALRHPSGERLLDRPAIPEASCQSMRLDSVPSGPVRNAQRFTVVGKHSQIMPTCWHRGRCQGFVDGPAAAQPPPENLLANVELASPLSNCERNSIMREVVRRALVVCLLLCCLPTAVRRFIIAVVVYSSDGVFWGRLWPHVLIKRKEGISPSLTDDCSLSSVARIVRSRLVMAPALYVLPCAVFGRISHPVAVASPLAFGRIARSHLKLLHSFMVVRAESVHYDRLGSFYCIRQGRLVQHI